MSFNYIPGGATLQAFHDSNARRRFIMGPIGSGKSASCCIEVLMRASQQRPNDRGIRQSRAAIIRNTYSELKLTTINTWIDWYCKKTDNYWGRPSGNGPIIHHLRGPLADGTFLDCEVIFLSMDKEDDVKKLMSLELTYGYVNEAKFLPVSVINTLDDRIGRYPQKEDGGASWFGIWGDTNPPDDDHWYYHLAEETRPDGWDFFRQPPGLLQVDGKWVANPKAENLQYLTEGIDYYPVRAQGKGEMHIKVLYANRYGMIQEGKLVIHEYNDLLHCSKEPLEFAPGVPIRVGLDFGLTPAAALCQWMPSGQWRVVEEIVSLRMGAKRFAKILKPRLQQLEEQGFVIEHITGDPAGNQEAQTDERTPFQIVREQGVNAMPAGTNDATIRRDVMGDACSNLIDGQPAFLISPACRYTRKGLGKHYCLRKIAVETGRAQKYAEKPDKNEYSHVIEACQYAMIGAGMGRELIGANRAVRSMMRRQGRGYGDHRLNG